MSVSAYGGCHVPKKHGARTTQLVRGGEPDLGQESGEIAQELSSGALQSPDDLDATYRKKNDEEYRGQVVSVTETANPANPLNLVTDVAVAPNNTDDSTILNERLEKINFGRIHRYWSSLERDAQSALCRPCNLTTATTTPSASACAFDGRHPAPFRRPDVFSPASILVDSALADAIRRFFPPIRIAA